jgi:parvulin-like peptidyl-prolyl isomerase
MEMKTRLLFAPLVIALVASLAACGGGGKQVPANAIAVVGNTPIPIAQFNDYLAQAKAQAVAQGGTAPQSGTPQYAAMQNTVVSELVQIAEVKQQAPKEGVSVTPADVTKYISNLVKTSYSGSMKKFTAALTQQGLTMKAAQQAVYINLLATKIHTKVTATATVTAAQEQAYYTKNLSSFSVAAATTRNIQYILFKCAATGTTTCPAAKSRAEKKRADMVEQKLQNGASFTAMAKQYSDDSSTASTGGNLCISKSGQSGSCIPTVPAFSTAAFALKTGAISPQPINATSAADSGYGWFIVKATAPVKNTKAHTSSFPEVEAQIKATLLQQAQATIWKKWLDDLTKEYQGKVSYQAAYTPPTTTAISTQQGVTTG